MIDDIANCHCQRLVHHQVKREFVFQEIINGYLEGGKEAIKLFEKEYREKFGDDGTDVRELQAQLASAYKSSLRDIAKARETLRRPTDWRARHEKMMGVAKAALAACEN